MLGLAFFAKGRDHSAVRVSCSADRRKGICVVVARDGTAPSRVADGIVASGGEALRVACDVAEYAAVEAMIITPSRMRIPAL